MSGGPRARKGGLFDFKFKRVKKSEKNKEEDKGKKGYFSDEDRREFAEECLDSHNIIRASHGVGSLELDNDISNFSQSWADYLLHKNKIKHSPEESREDYGENIYWSSLKYIPGNLAVERWYSEGETFNYDYDQGPYSHDTGHFTQLLWRGSKYLGVGVASSKNGTYVVCNYYPRGNIKKKYIDNVPPPI